MVYTVRWGVLDAPRRIRLARGADLDDALDTALADLRRHGLLVHITNDDSADRLDVLVGHPARAALAYVAKGCPVRYAVQASVPPLGWSIQADADGQARPFDPPLTRLVPEKARTAAREWFYTGNRPTHHLPTWITIPQTSLTQPRRC